MIIVHYIGLYCEDYIKGPYDYYLVEFTLLQCIYTNWGVPPWSLIWPVVGAPNLGVQLLQNVVI